MAGPVAVCAFAFLTNTGDDFIEKAKTEHKLSLRDSKKLTAKQREKWFKIITGWKREGLCDFAITFVDAKNIDKFGIAPCIQKALNTSLAKLTARVHENYLRLSLPRATHSARAHTYSENFYVHKQLQIYLDGGLKAPPEYVNQQTIIKGDELHPIISLASIVAKVSRDQVMAQYAKKYTQYGLDTNMGYGSAAHMQALKTYGLTPIHRKSFIHI